MQKETGAMQPRDQRRGDTWRVERLQEMNEKVVTAPKIILGTILYFRLTEGYKIGPC